MRRAGHRARPRVRESRCARRSAIARMSGGSSSPVTTSVGALHLADPVREIRRRAAPPPLPLRRATGARTRGAASRRPRSQLPDRPPPATDAGRRPTCAGSPRRLRRDRRARAQPPPRPSRPASPPTSRRPGPPGFTSTSFSTRSGCATATSSATRAAQRAATSEGRSRPTSSRRSTRSRACEIRPWPDRRVPEAAQVEANGPVRAGERLPLRLPHAAVADRLVDEHDGRSLTRLLPVEVTHAATSCPRLAAIPSISSVNESMNFCTPSRSSVSVTSS